MFSNDGVLLTKTGLLAVSAEFSMPNLLISPTRMRVERNIADHSERAH